MAILETFFDYDSYGFEFFPYSFQHLAATLIFAIIPVLLVYVFRNKLKKWRYERLFVVCVGVLGLLIEFTQYYWHYHGGQTDWREIYPTTLCGLTIYLSSLAMMTSSKYLSSLIFFYSHGAFFSFLLPQQSFGFDRFRFYAYFVIHGLIFFNTAYVLLVKDNRADKKAMLRSGVFILPVLILSQIFNNVFSDASKRMNFFYMDHPPFEFPVYSWFYEISGLLYSLSVFISYFLLLLIMFGISNLLGLNRTKEELKVDRSSIYV